MIVDKHSIRKYFLWSYAVISFLLPGASSKVFADGASLEEVVVTARRRDESLQETPIAVSVFTAEELRNAGITSTDDLAKSVPSLQVINNVSTSIYIRGVGERTGFARLDPTVGVYLDDFFLPRADSQVMSTVGVQSIQVLRGPQGTLFGKNTTGGAIILKLIEPIFETNGFLEGTVGNYETYNLKGSVGGALSDTLAGSVTFNAVTNDGFQENISTDDRGYAKDDQTVFGQLLWEASDTVSVDVLGYLNRIREDNPLNNCEIVNEASLFGTGLYFARPGDTNPAHPTAWVDNCETNNPDATGNLNVDLGRYVVNARDYDEYMLGTSTKWEISDTMESKLILAYRESTKSPNGISNDGGPALFYQTITDNTEADSFSTELQLTGTLWDDRVSYSSGIFLMRETNKESLISNNSLLGADITTLLGLNSGQIVQPPDGGTTPVVGSGLLSPYTDADFSLENDSAAAYSQVVWDITTEWQLTAGIRYTAEKRSAKSILTKVDNVAIVNGIVAAYPGLFTPLAEPSRGLVLFNGTWAQDPVGLAQAVFSGVDSKRGIYIYPLDYAGATETEEDDTFTQATPMLSLSYNVPEDWLGTTVPSIDSLMTYVTVSDGFKSGFFEPRGVDGLQKIDPETLRNTEIGTKLDAFDRTVRLNIAAYKMDFEDQQLINVGVDSEGNSAVVFGNVGKSEIKGVEIEGSWLPTDRLLINLSASFNDYEYLEFDEQDLIGVVLGQNIPVDRTDEKFPNVPDRTVSLGVQYTFDSPLGIFVPRLDLSYRSEVYFGLDNGAWDAYKESGIGSTGEMTLVDFRILWSSDEEARYYGSLFVTNLTDKDYVTGTSSSGDATGLYNRYPGPPRQYGINFGIRF